MAYSEHAEPTFINLSALVGFYSTRFKEVKYRIEEDIATINIEGQTVSIKCVKSSFGGQSTYRVSKNSIMAALLEAQGEIAVLQKMTEQLFNPDTYSFLASWTKRIYMNPNYFVQMFKCPSTKVTLKEVSREERQVLMQMFFNDTPVSGYITCWNRKDSQDIATFSWEVAYGILGTTETSATALQTRSMIAKKITSAKN